MKPSNVTPNGKLITLWLKKIKGVYSYKYKNIVIKKFTISRRWIIIGKLKIKLLLNTSKTFLKGVKSVFTFTYTGYTFYIRWYKKKLIMYAFSKKCKKVYYKNKNFCGWSNLGKGEFFVCFYSANNMF